MKILASFCTILLSAPLANAVDYQVSMQVSREVCENSVCKIEEGEATNVLLYEEPTPPKRWSFMIIRPEPSLHYHIAGVILSKRQDQLELTLSTDWYYKGEKFSKLTQSIPLDGLDAFPTQYLRSAPIKVGDTEIFYHLTVRPAQP